MSNADKQIKVWVQNYRDRDNLKLQWVDPDTGKRKSQSARTADPRQAERLRAQLEYELNAGVYRHVYLDPLPARIAEVEEALPSLAVPGQWIYFIRQLPGGP